MGIQDIIEGSSSVITRSKNASQSTKNKPPKTTKAARTKKQKQKQGAMDSHSPNSPNKSELHLTDTNTGSSPTPKASPPVSKSPPAPPEASGCVKGNSSQADLYTLEAESSQEPSKFDPEFTFQYVPCDNSADVIISPKDRGDQGAMYDAFNKVYALLRGNHDHFVAYMSFNDERYTQLYQRLSKVDTRLDTVRMTLKDHDTALSDLNQSKVSQSDFNALKSEFADFKASCDLALEQARSVYSKQQKTIDLQHQLITNANLDIKRSFQSLSDLNEQMNVNDIRSRHLHVTVEGLPETQEGTTVNNLITRFNNDAEASLTEADFAYANRSGKLKPNERNPRQVKIKLANDAAKNKILACRGKLKPNPNKSYIWINEDHPDAYRRRKIMLRELSKHINKLKDHSATLESGGIRVDGQFYNYDQFDDLPENCKPRDVQVITNKHNCTLFAGEWAFLSNMYSTTVVYENTKFTSAEQCYQFNKAPAHGEFDKAHRIIITNDPFKCKKIGGSITDNQEWLGARENVLTEIVKFKFAQNSELLEQLLATGDSTLQEATLGGVWGINTGLRSKAACQNTGTGENKLGKILMSVRTEFANETSPSPSVSNPESESESESESEQDEMEQDEC